MHKIQHVATSSSELRFNSVCVSLLSGSVNRLDVVVEILGGRELKKTGPLIESLFLPVMSMKLTNFGGGVESVSDLNIHNYVYT